jgi:hypothetical protein
MPTLNVKPKEKEKSDLLLNPTNTLMGERSPRISPRLPRLSPRSSYITPPHSSRGSPRSSRSSPPSEDSRTRSNFYLDPAQLDAAREFRAIIRSKPTMGIGDLLAAHEKSKSSVNQPEVCEETDADCDFQPFDWNNLCGVKGTFEQTFKKEMVIVEANAENDWIFRLLEGSVEVRKGDITFATIHHTDRWPIFCEMSAFATEKAQKITSMSIVASTNGCRVQVIPRIALLSFFNEGPHHHEMSCLFFETMCRHFTSKLKGVHTRTLRSGTHITTYRGCITIKGETVIFSTPVRFFFC